LVDEKIVAVVVVVPVSVTNVIFPVSDREWKQLQEKAAV
jgi:hypothetical protein